MQLLRLATQLHYISSGLHLCLLVGSHRCSLYGSNADTGCVLLQLLDHVVPTLVARAEALERRAKAAAKIAAQLNSIVPDDDGHYGRSRRHRTQAWTLE